MRKLHKFLRREQENFLDFEKEASSVRIANERMTFRLWQDHWLGLQNACVEWDVRENQELGTLLITLIPMTPKAKRMWITPSTDLLWSNQFDNGRAALPGVTGSTIWSPTFKDL